MIKLVLFLIFWVFMIESSVSSENITERRIFKSQKLEFDKSAGTVIGLTDCLPPYCSCINTTTLLCNNFTSFDQLDFRLTNNRLFKTVEIRPISTSSASSTSPVRVNIDEKLNFNGLKLNGSLILSNIGSFSAFYNPFRLILYDQLSISIFNSNLRFLGRSGGQIESSILNNCNFLNGADHLDFVFSNLKLTQFSLCSVVFETPLCPFLFRNSKISNLIIVDPIGAFGFQPPIVTPNTTQIFRSLNTFVNQIDIKYNNDENNLQEQWLDAKSILNPEFFTYLDRVNINSARRLSYIQEDTFKLVSNVKKFELNNIRFRDLITRSRRWIKNLNYKSKTYDIDNINLDLSLGGDVFQLIMWYNSDWSFNEESDICLFKNFPHNKLVFPFLLFSPTDLPCSCTIYWLYKYFPKYQRLYNLNQNIMPMHCFTRSNWDSCHFESLFNRWCPNSVDDPEEPFTTLVPNRLVPTFTSSSTTNRTALTTTTTNVNTLITLTGTTSTQLPPILGSTTTTRATTSAHLTTTLIIPNSTDSLVKCKRSTFSTVSFYLAIILSVVAAFLIAALVVLYYGVFFRRKNNSQNNQILENDSSSIIDTSNSSSSITNNNNDEYI